MRFNFPFQDISPYNTRLFKTKCKETGKMVYEVRLASADTQGELPEDEIRYLTITERSFCIFLHKTYVVGSH